MISNITVPLLSIVDISLAGRMGTAGAIGAVAVAGGVVNFVYWLFAFLRMGTTGYTAQAFGRSDVKAITLQLARGISLGLLAAIIIIAARPLLYHFSYLLSAGRDTISGEAQRYLSIAFMGAPAALMMYVFNGWYVGMQNTRIPMIVAITSNIINITLSLYFVKVMQLGIPGLAIGTVIAQYAALGMLILYARLRFGRILRFMQLSQLKDTRGYGDYLRTGRDLFLRTAMLGSVTLFFTWASSYSGEVTVAANALLMQLFTLFSYFMDGFAYAGEALTGRYLGHRKPRELHIMVRQLFRIGWALSVLASLIYLFFPETIIRIFSNEPQVVAHAIGSAYWAALIPIVSFGAFLWDGIFVGATASKELRQTMTAAFVIYFIIYFSTRNLLGEGALWLAFICYLGMRSVMQHFLSRKVLSMSRASTA
ncbi:MATE family efflux transporter [Porphyromonas pogonae]|uniref:MATE family efflux transporter n=1 Tax=Porphyromonas pogonae TaxID=867595 RepID=UPI002E788ABB|nr:MATE family efflux transporter [Porphyromonas pogonae]